MTYREATSRLIFMSWNPGAGARKLAQVIDTVGYHVVAVQEARADFLSQLDPKRWSYVLEYDQFVGARIPSTVESHCGGASPGRMRWHFATVSFPEKRVNLSSLGILSLHLNNILAKKTQAGYEEVGRTIDKACAFKPSSHTVDVICGDLNMSRWSRAMTDKEAANWNEGTLGELEKRGYIPVADYTNECCFVAVHDSIAQSLHIRGSSWGERSENLNPAQRKAFHRAFLEQVGARQSSQDVHWPMSLAIRMSTKVRPSGLRQRKPEAIARRNEKKRQRRLLRRSSGSGASSSGSAAPAAQAALADRAHWDSDSNRYGRSSWSGWRSDWSGWRSSGSGAWPSSGSGASRGWRSSGGSDWHGRSSGSGAW